MIVYEVTITVKQLCVRMLFKGPPSVERIIDTVKVIFADHQPAQDGIIELILSVGDQEEWKKQVLNEGDVVHFSQDDEPIGQMDVQTRTLFDV